jgi:hypothetical protein
MLKPANAKARQCYDSALEARQRALQARTTAERDDFLAIENSWLNLAASYEFSERLDRFTNKGFPKHPICPSCGVPMWLVQMNSTQPAIEFHYECKVCSHTVLLNVSDHD